jgi:hypothetical protein
VIVVLQGSSNRLSTIAINSGLACAETFQQVSEILINLTGFGCGVGRESMGKTLTHCRNRYESQTKKREGQEECFSSFHIGSFYGVIASCGNPKTPDPRPEQ